jgi:Domain of unknown function (DUF222)
MFGTAEGTIDQALEREAATCLRRLAELCEQAARRDQEVSELVRAADDRGDWKRAGFSSSAAWFAHAYRSDHKTAVRVTETSEALRLLPALEHAFSTGELTLDQVAAATPFATPETDAQLARAAVGKAPEKISLIARTLSPPKVLDDQELYKRRSLRMTWINGKRELAISGRLPLEQGVVVEQALWELAKTARADDKKKTGATLEWQQYCADALVTAATNSGGHDGSRRSNATIIVHLAPNAPPVLEGAGPISA